MIANVAVPEGLTHLAGRRFAKSLWDEIDDAILIQNEGVRIKFPDAVKRVTRTFADEFISQICEQYVVRWFLDISPEHYEIDGTSGVKEVFGSVLKEHGFFEFEHGITVVDTKP